MERILFGKTTISNAKSLLKDFNNKYGTEAISELNDLLESTTGGKVTGNAISKINDNKNNSKTNVYKPVYGNRWVIDESSQGKETTINNNKNSSKANEYKPVSGNRWVIDESSQGRNNKNKINFSNNAGTQKVDYDYKGNTSSIKSNTGNRGTSQTTSNNNNNKETIKSNSKKEIVNVDNGIFGYEPTLNGLTKKEKKELNVYIDGLVEKFEKSIPKSEKERDDLIQKFKNNLYFTANGMVDNKNSSNKNNISSIKSELDKSASKFYKKDVATIKKDLKDSAYEEMKKEYKKIFKLAKQQADGKVVDANFNKEEEMKKLEKLLNNVKDCNKDASKFMMTEMRNDLEYINDKNYKSYSMRINQYIENKNAKEV